jgi:CheY-like chemotaxis protein
VSNGSKVLIVDDDLAARMRLTDLLFASGVRDVREATNGIEALETARAWTPDLIILDIMMPGMTGYEVCSALRSEPGTREIPIIVLSASDHVEAMIGALDAGADDFLRKPFAAPELRAKIRNITRLNRFQMLARERDRFRWLLDRSLEPVVIADETGAIAYANERARRVFGLDDQSGTTVGAAMGKHFRAEPADAWEAWREKRLHSGDSFAIYQPRSIGGAAQWFRVQLHALEGSAGQTVFKFTDRTVAVRRELEIFAFQNLVAHKIRAPHCGLKPIFDFLDIEDPERARHLIASACSSAERLQETLLGVLSQHEALFPSVLAPSAVVRRPLQGIIEAATDSVDPQPRVVLAAPAGTVDQGATLEFVVTELLLNFAKLDRSNSDPVQVMLGKRDEDLWALEWRVTGAHLAAEVIAQLDQPYRQLEHATIRAVPGVELTLATLRVLWRNVGGDIEFAPSAAPDAGLVVTLVFPKGLFVPSPG